jgi:hypothetical protein
MGHRFGPNHAPPATAAALITRVTLEFGESLVDRHERRSDVPRQSMASRSPA